MFLKNKNIIFKIRRSKVTDYAALSNKVATAVVRSKAAVFVFNSTFVSASIVWKLVL